MSPTNIVGGADNVRVERSIRTGSFFERSKLTLQKCLLIVREWAKESPVTDATDEAEIDIRSAADIYQWLREICTTKLLAGPNNSWWYWCGCTNR